jgi:acetyl-CoA carboxylase carboxyltransferase component
MSALKSVLDPKSDSYTAAASAAESRLEEIDAELAKALGGGGAKYVERHHDRGKLTARERIELLVDADSPFLELCPLAA